MRCDRAQALVSARTDGEATETESAALDLHLAGCATCRAFAATVGQVHQALAVTEVAGVPDVTSAVQARIGGSRQTWRRRRRPVRGAEQRRRLGGGSRPAAVAAVLVIVVAAVAGFWAGRGSQADVTLEASGRRPPGDSARPARPIWTGPVAVVWARDQVGADLVARVRAVDTVARSSVVVRGTVGLTASRAADGTLVDHPAAGWSVPLDAIAVDIRSYGPLVGGRDAATFAALRGDEALLGRTAARLRGLGRGATVDVGGRRLVIAGIVDDAAVGAAELAVARSTGARIGLSTVRYVIVGYRGSAAAFAGAVESAADTPVRIRDAADAHVLRNADAVLPQVQVKQRFGEFTTRFDGEDVEVDDRWFDEHMETVDVPLLGQVTCNRETLPPLRAVLADLEAEGLAGLVSPERFQGCWNPKQVRGTGDLSRHTWGAAVDLAPIGTDDRPTQDPRLVAAFERHGFTWGGAWLVPDPGHFELVDPPGTS